MKIYTLTLPVNCQKCKTTTRYIHQIKTEYQYVILCSLCYKDYLIKDKKLLIKQIEKQMRDKSD